MSAQEIYYWFFLWLAVAVIVVVAAAALLVTIVLLARRIASLAQAALALVEEIEQQTKPIWQLNATNRVAKHLLVGAKAIDGNANAIAGALAEAERRRAA